MDNYKLHPNSKSLSSTTKHTSRGGTDRFAIMSTKSRTRNNRKSICETSMDLVFNLIKASSLSLAQISLGTSRVGSPTVPPPPPFSNDDELVEEEPLIPGSQRLRKRKGNNNKPIAIPPPIDMIPPPVEMIQIPQEVKDVDGMATKFIDKVHRSFKL
eukprot:TRINITY_DN17635_c0_g2_i7.p1 TRINITY_DN17635_c0_g2~~TRINITY_DN17635_c0_g2_i7.p1  ORF type:complete len:157 (+),score=28.79 TRINITY_DN17635_c0_g2_i7:191-661(+)